MICPLGDESGVLLDSTLYNSSEDLIKSSDLPSSDDRMASSDSTFSAMMGSHPSSWSFLAQWVVFQFSENFFSRNGFLKTV